MAGRRRLSAVGCTALGCLLAGSLAGCMTQPIASAAVDHGDLAEARCDAAAVASLKGSPVPGLVVTGTVWNPPGSTLDQRGGGALALPAHCEINGYFAERPGRLGQTYRIGFQMRLPAQWNGRFLFQGGGGSNGVVRPATGFNGAGNPSALERGYAVISQDSGHDNSINTLPDHEGEMVFGFDPEARRNYGHASLKPVNDLAHHLMRVFYGRDSGTNLFWGCSKGGQEGMAFAQRYPEAFDGIVAMAPGMSLPRAAVAEAWDTQAFARILVARGEPVTPEGLASAFAPRQFALVQDAVLAACDDLDGTADGVIGAVGQCTTARVEPQLRRRQCSAGGSDCLEPAQIDALIRALGGPKDSSGKPLYSEFTWDRGIGETGWLAWKLGMGATPSRNIVLGAGSLAAVFTTPPAPLANDPPALLAWQLRFDFDRDARKIYATSPLFRTSAWRDIGMRSTDLAAFRAHGGKLIVPHGVSDPVFSIMETIDWWKGVNERTGGHAADFVRVFPVPGMNHCSGGPTTDRFDSLSALEDWVIGKKAPDAIDASASDDRPGSVKHMPLCAYPSVAVADGHGGFDCKNFRAGSDLMTVSHP